MSQLQATSYFRRKVIHGRPAATLDNLSRWLSMGTAPFAGGVISCLSRRASLRMDWFTGRICTWLLIRPENLHTSRIAFGNLSCWASTTLGSRSSMKNTVSTNSPGVLMLTLSLKPTFTQRQPSMMKLVKPNIQHRPREIPQTLRVTSKHLSINKTDLLISIKSWLL